MKNDNKPSLPSDIQSEFSAALSKLVLSMPVEYLETDDHVKVHMTQVSTEIFVANVYMENFQSDLECVYGFYNISIGSDSNHTIFSRVFESKLYKV